MATSLFIHEARLSSDAVSVEKLLYDILSLVHHSHNLHTHLVHAAILSVHQRPTNPGKLKKKSSLF